jgi:hypothetical protein
MIRNKTATLSFIWCSTALRLWVLILLLLLAGCTHIRPVHKVALIAPFEGLYRERGYEALAALRAALSTCVPSGVAILPVALDDSGQSEKAARAAQNLLADPSVMAII